MVNVFRQKVEIDAMFEDWIMFYIIKNNKYIYETHIVSASKRAPFRSQQDVFEVQFHLINDVRHFGILQATRSAQVISSYKRTRAQNTSLWRITNRIID